MSTSAASKAVSKNVKKTRLVTLRLSPDSLARFPSDVPSTKSSTTIKIDPSPSAPPPDSAERSSDSNATPAADGADANASGAAKQDGKRKRGGGQIAGRKRAPPTIDPNGPMRERGRPGPKKKPRLADGTIDHSTDGTTVKKGPAGANPIPAHKLGPKANTGAINAGLRALDRSGKPCRKWERKGLQIKSFTGTTWGMSSWKAPPRDNFSGDVKSDTTGSSDLKPNESSAVASERSHSGGDAGETTMITNGLESSPAPAVAA